MRTRKFSRCSLGGNIISVMEMLPLLKTQRKALFDSLVGKGLNHSSFTFKAAASPANRTGTVIRFKSTRFHFTFKMFEELFTIERVPGDKRAYSKQECKTWGGLLERFNLWLDDLRREVETPDPWEQNENYETIVSVVPSLSAPNEPFSLAEQRGIWKALVAMQGTLLAATEGIEEQQAAIRAEIQNLKEATERMGRKDWVMLTIGTLVSLATAMTITPEATKAALNYLRHSITGFVPLLRE